MTSLYESIPHSVFCNMADLSLDQTSFQEELTRKGKFANHFITQ